jgi:carbon monoxide dehydrogenase subunit G
MSALKIEERFELDAHPDEAWAYLTRPDRIVVCLPGAELTEVVDERNYVGRVKVKLGAVTMDYRGTAEFTEVDPEQRVIRMKGKGRERRGGGTVSLAMESTIRELEGGRCEVTVVADIQLAGKIIRFGRGMIQAVTAEIFKEFTVCLAAELAGGKPPGEASDGDAAAQPCPAEESGDLAGTPAGSSSETLSLLPLLLRSLGSWLRRLFGRE